MSFVVNTRIHLAKQTKCNSVTERNTDTKSFPSDMSEPRA